MTPNVRVTRATAAVVRAAERLTDAILNGEVPAGVIFARAATLDRALATLRAVEKTEAAKTP